MRVNYPKNSLLPRGPPWGPTFPQIYVLIQRERNICTVMGLREPPVSCQRNEVIYEGEGDGASVLFLMEFAGSFVKNEYPDHSMAFPSCLLVPRISIQSASDITFDHQRIGSFPWRHTPATSVG
jgi:hypothetical protein